MMAATSISPPGLQRRARRRAGFGCGAVLVTVAGLLAVCAGAESQIVARAKTLAAAAYADARAAYRALTGNGETAWQFGRACFDWAEFATNNTQRAEISEEGITACRRAVARDPRSAPAHYYLAMNLGKLADTKRGPGALKMVKEIEREFFAACNLDEQFDYAGPDRNLGLLYWQAPGWPLSVGSRTKARQHLQRAVELAPDYPENRLNLVEACLKWSERREAARELAALEASLPRARTNFAGEAWALSWTDWEARLNKARKRGEEAAKPLESPHGRD